MFDKQDRDFFLALVRLGIGCDEVLIPAARDWLKVFNLANQQGLTAIVVDGIERLPETKRPSKSYLLQAIGHVMQNYELRYDLYCRAISEMAGWYTVHGFKMMVIKGLACGLDWPKPEHRPYGDIDIWVFGKQKESDALLEKEKGIDVDTTHHHHTLFDWRGFRVENHYDFINVHHHKMNTEYEAILKTQGKDDNHYIELYGERVYLPSSNLHALFMLKHLMMHFSAEKVTIRQLLDWAFFVKMHSKDVDWNWLIDCLDKFGMLPAFYIFNSICVNELGFDASLFPLIECDKNIKERVLSEIISPEFDEQMPRKRISRIIYKFRRWRTNAWKHNLCYKESLWSAFWSGVWNHLLKPSTL